MRMIPTPPAQPVSVEVPPSYPRIVEALSSKNIFGTANSQAPQPDPSPQSEDGNTSL